VRASGYDELKPTRWYMRMILSIDYRYNCAIAEQPPVFIGNAIHGFHR